MTKTKSDSKKYQFRLHGLVPYDRGAKVRWLLAEVGADYEMVWMDREKKEHEDPKYLRINPMGRVPALEFNDQGIFESGAICALLGDLFIDRGIAPALDSPERAKYQQWLYFAASTIDVFQTRIMIIEDIPEGEIYKAKLTALQSDVRDAMATLDSVFANSSYLVGNKLTVADLCVSYHLSWCNLWPELEGVMKDFPRVNSYVERMKALPSAVKADVFSYKG